MLTRSSSTNSGRGLMNSIIQERKECYVTGVSQGLHLHHCFKGSRRKLADKYGLTVWLHYDVHRRLHDHSKPYETLENDLKAVAQKAFEDNGGTREEFRAIFGASYL